MAAIEDLQTRAEELCFEPQLSIPDVVFWVLTDGKRRAYCRVPADQLLYHANDSLCGPKFGAVQSVFLTLPRADRLKTSDVRGGCIGVGPARAPGGLP